MTTHRRSLAARAGHPLLPALAAAALVLAACGGDATRPVEPVATTTVELPKSYRFEPAAISVTAGSTVTWTNSDNFTHNVSFEGEAPMTMAPGQTASRAFADPGTYAYLCTLHPNDMTGTVLVTGS